jgi:hypothetical protein
LDESVPLQSHVEDAGDSDGALDPVQTERDDLRVVAVLEPHAERRQERRPRGLEHRPDVVQVFGRGERRLHVRHRLHQILRGRGDGLHLHVEQDLPALLAVDLLLARLVHRVLHLDLVAGDLVVYLRQILFGDVLAVRVSAVDLDVLLLGHLVLHLGRVQVRRQHYNREAQDVRGVGAGEEPVVGVALAIPTGELLHQSVDLLRLARQPEPVEEVAQGRDEVHVDESPSGRRRCTSLLCRTRRCRRGSPR